MTAGRGNGHGAFGGALADYPGQAVGLVMLCLSDPGRLSNCLPCPVQICNDVF